MNSYSTPEVLQAAGGVARFVEGLTPIESTTALCGPAATCACAPGDNLAVHRLLELAPASCVKEHVLSLGEPVTIGGVEIAPGDHVIADRDAILVVAAADWPAVEAGAREIREAEDELRIALNQGQHLSDLVDLPE